MRVAVLGDIHANASALRAALKVVDARGCDQLIFLGDLLTYGVDVEETLNLVAARIARANAVVLRGNHDALYDDLVFGNDRYFAVLPAWIRESVNWTRRHLADSVWQSILLLDEYRIGKALFSHANPYGPRRWEYLNSLDEHLGAATVLKARGLDVGVFGHTHRTRWFRHENEKNEFRPPLQGELDSMAIHILNAGAIGQPRDRAQLAPHVLWMVFPRARENTYFEYERYSYDTGAHLSRMSASDMSPETVLKLSSFFLPSTPLSNGDLRPDDQIHKG